MLIDLVYKFCILWGDKVIMICYGDYEVKLGSEVYLVIMLSDIVVVKVRIIKVEKKKVREFMNEDVKLDGFLDVKEFFCEFLKIYGEFYGDDEVIIIGFEVVKCFEDGILFKWFKGLNYCEFEEIVCFYFEN